MTTRDKILSYIFKFATEEELTDLTDFLSEHYPIVNECSKLHIPPGGLYGAVEMIETAREQSTTKEVRALFNYYDDILDVPHTAQGIPLCALPEQKAQHSSSNVDKFPFLTNILSCTNHPQLPNILITTTSSKDIVVVYIPTTDIIDPVTNQQLKPFILARYSSLPSIVLTTQTIIIHDPKTNQFKIFILAGGIDGTFHVFSLSLPKFFFSNIAPHTPLLTDNNKNTIPEPGTPNQLHNIDFILELQKSISEFEITLLASDKPHQRYLTHIIPQTTTYSPLPSSSTIRITTSSHDQSVAFIDLVINSNDNDNNTITLPDKVTIIIAGTIEFKGKVEAMKPLHTPNVYKDKSHPIFLHPTLVQTTTPSRYYSASVRKLFKGNYLDNVEFITESLPFDKYNNNNNNNNEEDNNDNYANLIAISVRHDPNILIIDTNTMTIIDKINVNINGDDHVSFTVLDIEYDQYYGLLYLATDAQTILIMDIMTKQHVRRLYCTDNNDMSTPLLRLVKIPSFGLFNHKENYHYSDNQDGAVPLRLIKHAPYRHVVAITTSNNSIKVYNQHSQAQITEFNCNTKNIKGFVVIPPAHITEPWSFITTGFDKMFSVYY